MCKFPFLCSHFSHPFLGTYEVTQFFKLANLEGTPFQSGMTSIPFHHIMVWMPHTILPHTIPYHTIPFHHIPYHPTSYHTILLHTIPYHTIPTHTIPSFQRCLGSFLQNKKIIPAGCKTGPLSSIFCGLVLHISPDI